MTEDDDLMKYETYDFVRMRHVRRTIRTLLFCLEGTCWLIMIVAPLVVAYLLVRLFDNVGLLVWIYLPVMLVLAALMHPSIENCHDAIKELDDVERHIEWVNRMRNEETQPRRANWLDEM